MKQISTIINAILAAVLVFLLLSAGLPTLSAQAASPSPTPQPQPVCDSSRTVQVSGTAVVNVIPDRVLIKLGVQSNAVTVSSVQAINSRAMEKVIQALRRQGIQDKDIATDWYIVEPVYDDYNSINIIGYRINNLIAITLHDVKKVSTVIALALQSGANQVVSVEFYTTELRKYRDQAREMAMEAAAEKAAALTGAAGAQIGCVLNINEITWPYYYGGNQNLWAQNVVQNAGPSGGGGASADTEPVKPGQISVRAEVSVTFGLK